MLIFTGDIPFKTEGSFNLRVVVSKPLRWLDEDNSWNPDLSLHAVDKGSNEVIYEQFTIDHDLLRLGHCPCWISIDRLGVHLS